MLATSIALLNGYTYYGFLLSHQNPQAMVAPPRSPVSILSESTITSLSAVNVRGRNQLADFLATAPAREQEIADLQKAVWEEIMKTVFVFAAVMLAYQPCSSRSVNDEDSVVSVYKTLPSAAGGAAPLDVYRQIADNLAERITQPIYRFFGFNNSMTHETTTTKRPFEHIELGTPDNPQKPEINNPKPPANQTELPNEIPDRDVEELSLDSIQKIDKKPEKIILFSSYLPVKQNFELNDTNDIDSDDNSLELDDVEDDNDDAESGREGPFIYILELMGSIIQLLWGGFLALFKPASTSERQIAAS